MPDPTPLTPEQRAVLARRLAQRRAEADRLVPRAAGVPVPLSYTQRSLWLLEQMNPDAVAYNHLVATRARGPLDVEALGDAFVDVVACHEALHSAVVVDSNGLPYAEPLPPAAARFVVDDLEPDDDAIAARLLVESRRPFDLAGLPVRFLVLRHGPDDHTLAFMAHHIALDNSSLVVILADLEAAYAARAAGHEPQLESAAVQYGDYAVWQAGRLTGERREKLVAYWREELRGLPPLLELPLDHARPATQHFAGAREPIVVGAETVAALHAACRREGVTPYMFLLAVFGVVLYRWSGQGDLAVGTPYAGRDRVELERMVGFVNNTLVLRARLGGNPTWRDALATTKRTVLNAFEHAELPFELLVEELNPPRRPAYNPVFQVNFRVAPPIMPRLALAGVALSPLPIDLQYAKFDLALELHLRDDGIGGHVEYNRALFADSTARAVADAYDDTLRAVLAEPDMRLLTVPGVRPSTAARRQPMRRQRTAP